MNGTKINYKRIIVTGIVGGIIGGVIFGVMMQVMGRIEMIASMMGSQSLLVGWIIHLMISIIFGIGFVLLTTVTKLNLILLTILYGALIWIIGPLIIMPMMMGVGTNLANAFSSDQLMSLMTHIFFTAIVALVVYFRTRNN
ncbi:hypothetical protein E3U55_04405 [Filobacillus milosensis]|uniref:DUF1440 domain-containing protein n=1 Tax=Filobacillus milosensis TaxID=94137 RepID=A0A4Y8IV46_9BACI|nr:hypothetical protein [Filobacillus milosensis]TFB24059.1 hypothetical protein E3U55_04405 [Filobacillus milosensis]